MLRVLHVHYQVGSQLALPCFLHYICAANLRREVFRSCFPHYICTMKWPPPTSFFPQYICATNCGQFSSYLPQAASRTTFALPNGSQKLLPTLYLHCKIPVRRQLYTNFGNLLHLRFRRRLHTLDTHDLRRGLPQGQLKFALRLIRHADTQDLRREVHRAQTQFGFHLTFAHSARTISAAGSPSNAGQAFHLTTHDLRRRLPGHDHDFDKHDLHRGLHFDSIGPATPQP